MPKLLERQEPNKTAFTHKEAEALNRDEPVDALVYNGVDLAAAHRARMRENTAKMQRAEAKPPSW